MAIEASSVRELRDRTSAGFLDCKNALEEANGDFEKAGEILRKKGLAKAMKRDRVELLKVEWVRTYTLTVKWEF